MDPLTVHSVGRCGIDIAEVPEERSVYCNLSYDEHNLIEVDTGIRIWAENLIEDPNPHKGEDCEVWDSWISLENYDRMLDVLEDFSTEEYDDMNKNDVAYTPCTSRSSICFMCDRDIQYRDDDVLSITQAKGPIYCHPSCVEDFYKVVQSIKDQAPSLVARIL